MKSNLSFIEKLIEDDYTGKDLLLDLSISIQDVLDENVNSESTDFLFKKENNKNTQRLISMCFLRILSNRNYEKINQSKHQILKFIVQTVPDICSIININEKTETYQKEKFLKNYVTERDDEYSDTLIFTGKINDISTFQQEFRRMINNPKKNCFFQTFCKELISKTCIDGLFSSINSFIDAGGDEKYLKFIEVEKVITSFLEDCNNNGTRYAAKILSISFNNIYQILNKEIESSPYFLPTNLELKKTEKRYPFSKGSINSLSFVLSNDGKGFAKDVIVTILKYDNTSLQIESKEKFIGKVQFNEIFIDFEYKMLADISSTEIEISINWSSAINNGENNEKKIKITLHGQLAGINWDKVIRTKPYNLEPVENNTELIGRDSTLKELKNMLSLPLGSAYIYGQRRVGKTSIVKTLQNSVDREKILVVYIEAGDWNDATDAHRSMENLGKKICKQIKRFNSKFSSLVIPEFAGSFNNLTDFLDDAHEIDSNFQMLIILDEFDRISSSLYERGDIGRSFVLTIRSISNRQKFGFLLVGGEKMEYILSQWVEFNKFSAIRVDYFSKEKDLEDFRQLVKKPVENILDITDKAVLTLFNETSGNPYFTKKICMELFTIMVENRDTHVTEKEASKAIKVARNSVNIGATDFSHFWEDGINGKVDKEEEVSLTRRKILLILTQELLEYSRLEKKSIIDRGLEMGINGSELESYLGEFEQRKILSANGENFMFVVNFFKEWLVSGGREKIVSTFEEEQRVSIYKKLEEEAKVKIDEITDLLTKNWVYKGSKIKYENVKSWLDQFGDNYEQRIMFKVLQNFKVYSELDIREQLSSLFSKVKRDFVKRGAIREIDNSKRKRDDVLVVTLDTNPAKGSSYFVKLFADENNVYTDNIATPDQLEKKLKEKSNVKAVIFVDDIIGSGQTATENLKNYLDDSLKDVLNNKDVPVYLVAITGFQESSEKVKEALEKHGVDLRVIIGKILSDEDKCFNTYSNVFENSHDRKRAQEICFSKGERLEPKVPLGYSDSQLLVSFPENCPNNTLPIFWKKTDFWYPLFERK